MCINKLHREDGPAIERGDGLREWWQNGKLHRLDGPAIERPNGRKAWCRRGKLHRLDGPAVEYPDGRKEWWINGERVDPLTHTMVVNEYLLRGEK